MTPDEHKIMVPQKFQYTIPAKMEDRCVEHCLKFANKLGDNIRTSLLMPPTRFAVHGRNLRNSQNLTQFAHKTKRFQQSPVPYFVNLLNANQ